MANPDDTGHTFFAMVPEGLPRLALTLLSIVAAIIASQAMITGTFSITRQAIQLGFFPRLKITYTNPDQSGQIYLPLVNGLLAVGSIYVVLAFGSSERLAAAYGGSFVPRLPEYQKRNWLLAFAAYKYLVKRDNVANISATKLQKTQKLQVPGRMDARTAGDQTILMDGAHNGQKMAAFWQSFAQLYPDIKPVVLLALKQGKEVSDIAPLLKKYSAEVVVTVFTRGQDMPVLAIEPSEVVSVLKGYGVKGVAVNDQARAYKLFREKVHGVGVVTGSFYLIAQLRQAYKELA